MFKRSKNPIILYPYDYMRMAIRKGYRRRWWLIPTIMIPIIAGGGVWLLNVNTKSGIDLFSVIALYIFVGLVIVPIYLLVRDNMSHSDKEQELVPIGIEFLRKENYAPNIVKVIEKRAEIGSSAVQTRTLIPLLVLPVAISIIITWQNLVYVSHIAFLITILLVVVGFAFLQEIERANIDTVIRHSCVEYLVEKDQQIEDKPNSRNPSSKKRQNNREHHEKD